MSNRLTSSSERIAKRSCHAGGANEMNANELLPFNHMTSKRKRRRRKSLISCVSLAPTVSASRKTMTKLNLLIGALTNIIIVTQLICDTGALVGAQVQDSDSVYSSGLPKSTNSYLPQLSKIILTSQYNSNNNNHNNNHLMMADANTADSGRFSVVQRSDPHVRIKQGDTLMLSCKLDRPTDSHLWLRDGEILISNKGTFVENLNHENQSQRIISPLDQELFEQGDYSIKLINVQPEDSGNYSCQIGQDSRSLSIYTQLTVDQTPTQSPFTAPAAHSTLVNSYSSLSQVSADSPSSSNELDSTSMLSTGKSTFVNNNKAREAIMNTMPHLPDNQQLIITASGHTKSPSSSGSSSSSSSGVHHQYTHHQYANVRASSASPSSGLLASSSASSSSGINFHNMALVWPYLLLALAALLMLANVYLIFSLIKRHTRCSKEREANEDRGGGVGGSSRDDEDPSLA